MAGAALDDLRTASDASGRTLFRLGTRRLQSPLSRKTRGGNATGRECVERERPSCRGRRRRILFERLDNAAYKRQLASRVGKVGTVEGQYPIPFNREGNGDANVWQCRTFRGALKLSAELNDAPAFRGMIESPQMAEIADPFVQIIYGHSRWSNPTNLWAQKVCLGCSDWNPLFGRKLLTNTAFGFDKRGWTEPKFIDIPSRDGKVIKSKIYLPAGHDSKKKYPMAIFVHGAGYLQNTINGWNNYYREFMFNDLLAKKGYVVLDIDYRGSAGYGRDWRTDVYDFLGGKDYEDHIDAIDFMVKNYGVNQSKIGVYGGSYGGFMAAMLAARSS